MELEQNYVSVMEQRRQLKERHGELIFYSDPGSELACRELMEMLVQFMCKRYPQYFGLENDNTVLQNRLLNTTTDLLNTPPLEVVYQNVPEDYALVFRNENDGFYYLRAAMVCSSVGWDIASKQLLKIILNLFRTMKLLSIASTSKALPRYRFLYKLRAYGACSSTSSNKASS